MAETVEPSGQETEKINNSKSSKKPISVADNVYGLIAAIILMIALIVGIIVGTLKLVPYLGAASPDVDRQIAYVSAGVLYYVKDMTDPDPRSMPVAVIDDGISKDDKSLASKTGEWADSGDFMFSHDGRYLYFLDRKGASADLCRIETANIRYDEEINKGCIEVVQKGAAVFAFPSEDYPECVLIETQKSDLLLYDGSKIVTIAKSCKEHRISQNGVRIFYYTKGGDIGVYNIKKKTATLLAEKIDNLWELSAGDMFYTVKGEVGTDIYMIDVSEGTSSLVVSGCSYMSGWDEKTDEICFVTEEDVTLSFYDMTDDLWTDADYDSATSAKKYLSDKKYDVFDVLDAKDAKYYKKHPKKLAKYCDSLPDASDIAAFDKGYKYYKKTFAGITEHYVLNTKTGEWRKFDFASYEAAVSRLKLKEELENEEFTYRQYAVNLRSKDGKQKKIADSVCDVRYVCSDLVLYQRARLPVKISMDDIKDMSDVHAYFDGYEYEKSDEVLYASRSNGGSLGAQGDIINVYKDPDSGNMVIYSFEDTYGQLSFVNAYYYTFTDGVLSGSELSPESDGFGMWSGGVYYYPAGNDLFETVAGRSEAVLEEVGSPVYRYEYGLYLTMEDTEDNTLYLVTAGGEWIEIADEVSPGDYTLIYDDQIVYKSDGGLYVFLGSDKAAVMIAPEADSYACFGIKPEIVVRSGFF